MNDEGERERRELARELLPRSENLRCARIEWIYCVVVSLLREKQHKNMAFDFFEKREREKAK